MDTERKRKKDEAVLANTHKRRMADWQSNCRLPGSLAFGCLQARSFGHS